MVPQPKKRNHTKIILISAEQTDGVQHWSLYSLGDRLPDNLKNSDMANRLRYRAFLITSEMNGEDFYEFALRDLNNDGVEELITHGGGQINYARIWSCRGESVEEVFFTTWLEVYDNGMVGTSFHSGLGYVTDSFYRVSEDLQFDRIESITTWMNIDGEEYSVGENSYEENAPRVSKEEADRRRKEAVGNAGIVEITYHENTWQTRDRVLQ